MADETVVRSGEFRSTAAPRSTVISGRTFENKEVKYAAVDGMAMFEGDIVLGTVEEAQSALLADLLHKAVAIDLDKLAASPDVKKAIGALQDALQQRPIRGIAIRGEQARWPNNLVPYEIDGELSNPSRVTEAIQHWETHTKFRFKVHENEPDYVVFQPGSGCSSSVGRRLGKQFVTLGPDCTAGNAIHEIGHTIGLWHEQSRSDRDKFIRIDVTNIMAGLEHNFDQHISDGNDLGHYDYGSIMHYPAFAFAADASKPTIIVPAGVKIGQRDALSPGDIAAAQTIAQ